MDPRLKPVENNENAWNRHIFNDSYTHFPNKKPTFSHFQKFLSIFLILVKIRNLCSLTIMALKVSRLFEWSLKSFLFFKKLFLRKVQVSYKLFLTKK